ncbi:MAG: phage tail sheath family protein [Anaerolineae bacterium]|nr:phage tail sheath family protein [Anaerolineae bacterium]
MPEYLSPGVYVEEVSAGPRPIEGVGTSTAGFAGQTERGPEAPRLITSWLEFQRWYGDYVVEKSYLAYSVQGFFDNGGQRCFVTRVSGNDSAAAFRTLGDLHFIAFGRGVWGNNIRIKVEPATTPTRPDWLKITILYYKTVPDPFVDPTNPANATNKDRRDPDWLEVYDNVSTVPGASNNVEITINAASRLVRVVWAATGTNTVPVTDLADGALENGSEGSGVQADDYIGKKEVIPDPLGLGSDILGRGYGLAGLALVDEVALLLVPDQARTEFYDVLTGEAITQCALLKDRFAVLSVKQGESNVGSLLPPQDTSYGAIYYPWIWIFDLSDNRRRLIPPAGHIAGIMARTDIDRGVHKAPANEVVRSVLDLELPITKGDQDILNPRGINCIRDFRSDRRGIRLWGARTMASDSMWKYVNVRRLFIFIEESIEEGTQWVVFEPNDYLTWGYVTRSISNFLTRLWKNGALMGTTPEEAFFVRCDLTTMTQDDIDNGRLICYIGIAPVKPAEFVIFRISQKTAMETQQ